MKVYVPHFRQSICDLGVVLRNRGETDVLMPPLGMTSGDKVSAKQFSDAIFEYLTKAGISVTVCATGHAYNWIADEFWKLHRNATWRGVTSYSYTF